MGKQRNMKIGGDWHHMLGCFFSCFPNGRWEVSGKLAKSVSIHRKSPRLPFISDLQWQNDSKHLLKLLLP